MTIANARGLWLVEKRDVHVPRVDARELRADHQ
jgi:hypothetical protein